jgi:toxin ParE1/3/4
VKPVVIRPRAEADLHHAKGWYDAQRLGLGAQFLNVVNEAIHLLEERSEQYPFFYRDFRRVLLRRFPYKIFYRVEGQRVIVFRVLHAKRDHLRLLD